MSTTTKPLGFRNRSICNWRIESDFAAVVTDTLAGEGGPGPSFTDRSVTVARMALITAGSACDALFRDWAAYLLTSPALDLHDLALEAPEVLRRLHAPRMRQPFADEGMVLCIGWSAPAHRFTGVMFTAVNGFEPEAMPQDSNGFIPAPGLAGLAVPQTERGALIHMALVQKREADARAPAVRRIGGDLVCHQLERDENAAVRITSGRAYTFPPEPADCR